MKKSAKRVAEHKLQVLVFALLTAAVGLGLLHSTSAATYASTTQAESGNRTANAVLTSDTNASGGAAVMFSPIPGPTPTPTPPFRDDSSAIDEKGEFHVFCGMTHQNQTDAIVFPGQPGVSHLHSFYSNPSTDAFTTAASLLGVTGTCSHNMGTVDHSAYWVPALMKVNPDGTTTPVTGGDQVVSAYYRRAGYPLGPKVDKPFPVGLRMITGNAKATAPQSTSGVYATWTCGFNYPKSSTIANCVGTGEDLHASIAFPNCWDGVNLDSADHKSHMAFSAYNGTCPADHPVVLPEIWLELDYFGLQDGNNYVLSSGGKYSLHADFFSAWDMKAQQALIDNCFNQGPYKCESVAREGNMIVPSPDANRGSFTF